MLTCPHPLGRVGAAQNRWTCLGGHRIPIWESFDGGDRIDRYETCPGRDDVQADPATWAAAIRAWRTRTKTTVLRDYADLTSPHSSNSVLLANEREESAGGLIPEDVRGRRGEWTIVVTFVPGDG